MTAKEAIVYGLVQGLTEFLPISSTAHLRILPTLLGWSDPGAAFTAVIQLGTTAALFIYYRRELWALTKGSLRALATRTPNDDALLAGKLALGTVPIGILGVLLEKYIESTFRGLIVIGCALILFGALLYIADTRRHTPRTIGAISFRQALAIGFWQSLALIPGASRSGCALIGGLWSGLHRPEAARYGFLLGIPATTAAGIFKLKDLAGSNSMTLLAAGVALVTGLLTMRAMLAFLARHGVAVFSGYRVLLGVGLLIAAGLGLR